MNHLRVSLLTVFKDYKYSLTTIISALIILTLAVSLGNLRTLWYTLMNESARFLPLLFSFYGSLATNFTILSATTTVIISILFGINLSMIIYVIRKGKASKGLRRSGLGVIFGAFGVGCASCGAFLVTGALSLVGATGIVTLLPLRGTEFSFIAIGLILFSIWSVSKSINTSCKL